VDLYTAERLFLERHHEMIDAAERRQRLMPHGPPQPTATRVWIAGRLRALADRIESTPRLQRV
jgi:hypothetical protein